MIRYESRNLDRWVTPAALATLQQQIDHAHAMLRDRNGPGSDYLGWIDPASAVSALVLESILEAAKRIQESSELLVTVGIGGSYLGARAVLEALSAPESEQGVDVAFSGFHLSARDTDALLRELDDWEVSVNVISKSGTTTEPAIAFRILKSYMEERYGIEEARKRIYATTDGSRGALRKLADAEGYTTFTIPDDIGGRYSVLTPVGLLPIAAAGHDIRALLKGAVHGASDYGAHADLSTNPCARYAATRVAMARQGKVIEILSTFEPAFHYLVEWWKQLNGESEGKNRTGLFPAGCEFTTDLHSMGQWIQEGARNAFETFLIEENPVGEATVPALEGDADGLDYLVGRSLAEINRQAWLGTARAHLDGDMPNATVLVDRLDLSTMGELIHFFERATALSCTMQGVNPFDQPGVEAYKANMFALLGKPGFEEMGKRLRASL